ncbi:hypothetical protein M9Y10_012744 [Tritrichomonas musculus]|uniref:Uncharacterized protein n=1 Tax=Tritrichomonas musculus TaxID=1915356 RepID=A0ABR2IE25_9EUKA
MNSDDLLEALNLNELDQISGDDAFDDKSKQKEEVMAKKKNSNANKSSAKSNKPKPKRKGSQRPIINIDDLLDGVDLDEDNNQPPPSKPSSLIFNNNDEENPSFSVNISSQQNTKDFTPIQYVNPDISSPFTSRVELNIQSYLTTRFFNLRDDFVSELHRILIETDCIEVEVNKFINDLKTNLRDILSFELQNLNQINQVMSVVDTLCPAFLNVMKSIPNINSQDRQIETESANLAQVAVSTFSPVLKENFKTMSDELSKNINDLHDLQSQIKKNQIKNEKQRKTLKETLLDYESQKITQKIESQTISELSQRVSEFRKVYTDHDEEDEEGFDIDNPHSRLVKRLKSAIIRLRKDTETTHMEPVSRIRAFRRKLNDYREEASSMRNMILYNNQIFAQRSYQALALSQPPPPDFLIQSQILSQQQPQWQQPQPNLSSSFRYSQQDQPRVSFPGIGDDMNTSINSSGLNASYQDKSVELIDNVRTKLKQIQDQHEADLENISSFLQDLKKNEKQRVRAEIVNE